MARSRRVVSLLLAPFAMLLAASATGCGDGNAAARPTAGSTAPVAAPVPTPVTSPGSPGSFIANDTAFTAALPTTMSGTLTARARAVLRAELAGPVRELSVQVGDRVTTGMVLARLDVPAARVSVLAARAQVTAHESERLRVTRERERTATLIAVGGASRAEQEELDARVNASEAAIAAARAQLAVAEADLARAAVHAPFAGVVERRSATQGSIVQTGDELLTIVDPRVLTLEGGLAMTHASRARVGARVALRVIGWGDTVFFGRIVRVAPAVDSVTRQLRVTVELQNADSRLPVGAWAEGELIAGASAVLRRTTKSGVASHAGEH